MTKERAKELLPIISAFAEGKTIQYKLSDDEWCEIKDPLFTNNVDYRIKPEPRQWYIAFGGEDGPMIHTYRPGNDYLKSLQEQYNYREIIHVKEVI